MTSRQYFVIIVLAMPLFWRIVIGIIVAAFGFFMVWKTIMVQGWVGRIAWAEKTFGSGGTNTFLKLLGVGVVFLGVFYMTGIFGDIVTGLLSFITPD